MSSSLLLLLVVVGIDAAALFAAATTKQASLSVVEIVGVVLFVCWCESTDRSRECNLSPPGSSFNQSINRSVFLPQQAYKYMHAGDCVKERWG